VLVFKILLLLENPPLGFLEIEALGSVGVEAESGNQVGL